MEDDAREAGTRIVSQNRGAPILNAPCLNGKTVIQGDTGSKLIIILAGVARYH